MGWHVRSPETKNGVGWLAQVCPGRRGLGDLHDRAHPRCPSRPPGACRRRARRPRRLVKRTTSLQSSATDQSAWPALGEIADPGAVPWQDNKGRVDTAGPF